jgi:predicted phosphodiesterase
MKTYEVHLKNGRKYEIKTSTSQSRQLDVSTRTNILSFGYGEHEFQADEVEAVIFLNEIKD